MIKAAFRAGIGALALAGIAPAALAQSPPPPASTDIVVMGSKATRREIERTARAVAPRGDLYREPLAQYQEPVCPGVAGLSPDLAAAIVARIRLVAASVRAPVARPGRCRANLLVVFVQNGQAALQNLRSRGPWLFGPIDRDAFADLAADPALSDLAADPGPVHVWVNSEIRGRYGEHLEGRGDPSEPAVLQTPNAHSHIFIAGRRDIAGSLVVIDIDAAAGKTVEQLADYAAMRGLAQTRPPGPGSAVATILTLFDADATPPEEATTFDRAYLRAVYGSIPNIAGMTKLLQLAHELKQAAR